jgi:RimJ/RimL family protein N-acetyltransferase
MPCQPHDTASTARARGATIAGPRLLLRPFVRDDARAIAPNLRLPPATEGFFEGPHSVGELERWVDDAAARGVCLWAVVRDGTPVGLFTAQIEHDAIAHVGFSLDGTPPGEAAEALEQAVRWLFSATPVHRVAMRTTTFDVPRWRAAQLAGFRLEGVGRASAKWAGVWHDARHYARLRGDGDVSCDDRSDTNI